MSMALYTLEDCDAYCKVCGKNFVIALHGEKCPWCGNGDPETVSIVMGGSLGHEEPASFQKSRQKEDRL